MKNTLLILALVFIGFYSCKDKKDKDATPDYTERDEEIIQDYFTENKITDTIADPTGLYIKHLEIGEGELAGGDIDSVRVIYTGYYLPSETVLDNKESPVWFKLSGLIEGWSIGIPYMRKGGKATFYIPSRYGYGSSVLKFNITLVDFNREEK